MIKSRKIIKAPRARASFAVVFDHEEDRRWIAEIPKLPGVMAYGITKREALQNVYAIALRTLADGVEDGGFFAPVSRLFHNAVAHN